MRYSFIVILSLLASSCGQAVTKSDPVLSTAQIMVTHTNKNEAAACLGFVREVAKTKTGSDYDTSHEDVLFAVRAWERVVVLLELDVDEIERASSFVRTAMQKANTPGFRRRMEPCFEEVYISRRSAERDLNEASK